MSTLDSSRLSTLDSRLISTYRLVDDYVQRFLFIYLSHILCFILFLLKKRTFNFTPTTHHTHHILVKFYITVGADIL